MAETRTFAGERLRLAGVAKGLTLDELGGRVGATRQYLNQLEQGTKSPTDRKTAALAAALGVTDGFFALATKKPKLRWNVSAAAIVRRGYVPRTISANQIRTGYIHLSKTGHKKIERYDDEILSEDPELLSTALAALERSYPAAVRRIAAEAGLQDEMFGGVAGINLPQARAGHATVLPFVRR
jgi:transcriptional regulator with XRE-family HTH domain